MKTIIEVDRAFIDELENIPDRPKYVRENRFTPEIDRIILEYWPKKNRRALSKLLKIDGRAINKKYNELINAKMIK